MRLSSSALAALVAALPLAAQVPARSAAPDTARKAAVYVAGALSVPNADPFPSTYRAR